MKKLIMIAAVGAMALGCQTRITWTKHPETLQPVERVVQIAGTNAVYTAGYERASGGYEVTARSPLWADEALKGLNLSVGKEGDITFGLEEYRRDLSTNAVTMAHNLVTDFGLLAEKVAAAYATVTTGGMSTTATTALEKLIAQYISAGGDASKAKVTCENGNCTITDGTVCVGGNCTP